MTRVPKRADAGTEIVTSVAPQAEAAAEDEWSGSVEDLFEVLRPTPEQQEAIRRRGADVERYKRILSPPRDKSAVADMLREPDLPDWVRRSIAVILDPGKRWHPPWAYYDAVSIIVMAKNSEEVKLNLNKLELPGKIRAWAIKEA